MKDDPAEAAPKPHSKCRPRRQLSNAVCCEVKPGLPPWGPHVRFRQVQTLVREGSPFVKLLRSPGALAYAVSLGSVRSTRLRSPLHSSAERPSRAAAPSRPASSPRSGRGRGA